MLLLLLLSGGLTLVTALFALDLVDMRGLL